MSSSLPEFRAPTAVERGFNRVFGFLVGLGLGFSHSYLLRVRGRKSGRFIRRQLICWNSVAKSSWWLREGGRSGFGMPRLREK
jgi:hypothetical protein